MNAHLGDFSIVNLVVDSRSIAVGHSGFKDPLAVTGTIGYMARGINQECCYLLYLYKAICYAINNFFPLSFWIMLELFLHQPLGMFIVLEYYSWR